MLHQQIVYVFDTNIHLNLIFQGFFYKINFYELIMNTGCKICVTPVTEDEVLRNLKSRHEELIQRLEKSINQAKSGLQSLNNENGKLNDTYKFLNNDNSETILNKLKNDSLIMKIRENYQNLRKFCDDNIFNSSSSFSLEENGKSRVIKKAEKRNKFSNLPCTKKTYELGDCIIWETVLFLCNTYSNIVFSTQDHGFLCKDGLHPRLKEEIPKGISVEFLSETKGLIEHVSNMIPEEAKRPSRSEIDSTEAAFTEPMIMWGTSGFPYVPENTLCPKCNKDILRWAGYQRGPLGLQGWYECKSCGYGLLTCDDPCD